MPCDWRSGNELPAAGEHHGERGLAGRQRLQASRDYLEKEETDRRPPSAGEPVNPDRGNE